MANALNWFEIPVADLERATRFYEAVMGETLKRESEDGRPMAIFARKNDADVAGALVADPRRKPTSDGVTVYLNAAGKLDACLERVGGAGGKVLLPKTDIGVPGFIALVRDTEGNTVGLHAPR